MICIGGFMKAVGIICEYNPFHNGHVYHINKIKELYKDYVIVLIMSGHFTERGEISLHNKWEKTHFALETGVDIVVELPFSFATQSADIFSYGAIKILNEFNIEYLIFGSECNDINLLQEIASNQNELDIKKYLDIGYNYPTALAKSIKDKTGNELNGPNDLLGISYIKAINNINPSIIPITIKRTNDYHNSDIENNIISASTIRTLLKENKDIKKYIPGYVSIPKYIDQNNYFSLFKYKVLTEDDLSIYMGVDEGIENLIKKIIVNCYNFDDFIKNIKSKRYTYNRLSRMYIHILCNYTKQENEIYKNIFYIRLLGFSKNGQKYLNKVKKEFTIPLISKYNKHDETMLKLDLRATKVYDINLLNKEYQNKIEKV